MCPNDLYNNNYINIINTRKEDYMYILKSYQEIFNIAKQTNEFIIDISELSIKESIRVLDFITGLTFNGKLEKVDAHTFKCIIER